VLTEWAAETLTTFGKRSPLMMSVTLEQLHRGRRMSLADCFRMELNMIHASFEQGDFMEGVRALLVDKDRRPRWTPPHLSDVTQNDVDEFFLPRWTPSKHPLRALR
jgi:Enoyl-CoA hydratase/isomerase